MRLSRGGLARRWQAVARLGLLAAAEVVRREPGVGDRAAQIPLLISLKTTALRCLTCRNTACRFRFPLTISSVRVFSCSCGFFIDMQQSVITAV
jgi:hypothetical protein